MMMYLLVFILLFIPVVKYDWMAKTGGEDKWYYLNLVVLIFLAGLRYRVGGDTLMYMSMYDGWPTIEELKYFDFEEAEYQPLWYIFVAICKSFSSEFVFFQLIHATLILSIFFYCFRKYSPRYYFTVILIFAIGYYFYFSMEIMREVLCIAIMLLATTWLINRKWLLYYLACVVALYIHYSALLMFLFPIACWLFKKPSWKLQVIFFVAIFFLLNIVNLPKIIVNSLPISGQLSRMILSYMDFEVSVFGILFQVLSFLPIIGTIFVRQRIDIKDEYDFTPIVMASVVIYAFSTSMAGFSRFVNYFVPYIVMYIVNTVYPIIYRKFSDISVTYTIMTCVMFVYGFNISYYYLRDMSDIYPSTKYYVIFFPYSSVFDKKVNEHRERFVENYRGVKILF